MTCLVQYIISPSRVLHGKLLKCRWMADKPFRRSKQHLWQFLSTWHLQSCKPGTFFAVLMSINTSKMVSFSLTVPCLVKGQRNTLEMNFWEWSCKGVIAWVQIDIPFFRRFRNLVINPLVLVIVNARCKLSYQFEASLDFSKDCCWT